MPQYWSRFKRCYSHQSIWLSSKTDMQIHEPDKGPQLLYLQQEHLSQTVFQFTRYSTTILPATQNCRPLTWMINVSEDRNATNQKAFISGGMHMNIFYCSVNLGRWVIFKGFIFLNRCFNYVYSYDFFITYLDILLYGNKVYILYNISMLL
jgi:hypothetical protein